MPKSQKQDEQETGILSVPLSPTLPTSCRGEQKPTGDQPETSLTSLPSSHPQGHDPWLSCENQSEHERCTDLSSYGNMQAA